MLGGPNITANLYCICLSEHETCAYADAVQICGRYETPSIPVMARWILFVYLDVVEAVDGVLIPEPADLQAVRQPAVH